MSSMTDSQASDDPPSVEARLAGAIERVPAARRTDPNATCDGEPTDSDGDRHAVAPSADVAPELHEVTDT